MSGSLNGFNLGASMRKAHQPTWSGKPPLTALYDLLVAPIEEFLPQSNGTAIKDLVLVLQGMFLRQSWPSCGLIDVALLIFYISDPRGRSIIGVVCHDQYLFVIRQLQINMHSQ